MIVKTPISGKAGNTFFRLTVGKSVPESVLKYWKDTDQLEDLKKAGAIFDDKEKQKESENKTMFKDSESKKA